MKTGWIIALIVVSFLVIGLALSEGIGHLISSHIFSVV